MHAFARGTLSLGVFRFLLGIGEAGNWPGAVKVVAEWFPEKERALAAGLFNSGSAVGAILAPPIVAYLILRIGWQAAFAFVGLAGLLWLVFWFSMYHTPKALPGAPADTLVPVRELLRDALRVGVHLLEDLHGSRVVLLHFLVPGISEARARVRPGEDRDLRLDPLHGGGVRQYSGRMDVGAPAAARLES